MTASNYNSAIADARRRTLGDLSELSLCGQLA